MDIRKSPYRLLIAALAGALTFTVANTSAETPTVWAPVPQALFRDLPEPSVAAYDQDAPFFVASTPFQPTPKPPRPSPRPTRRPASPVVLRPISSSHRVIGPPTWYCKAGRSVCHYRYPDRPGVLDLYAAAGPALRVGDWRGRVVNVCASKLNCLRVRLVDWCACAPPHFLDLYWDAWNALGQPRQVTVTW
jgi:hypothetical protein